MEEKVKTIYMKPSTEVISMEKAPFVMTSWGGDAGTGTWGESLGNESKSFFSWSYEEREGIQSDKLTTDWE